MQKIFRRFFLEYKEYIVVTLLLVISISLISQNENTQIKKVRTLAFGGFALVHSISSGIRDVFANKDEIEELKKLNAELMLKVNLLREYGLENRELKELLNFRDTTNYELVPGKIISKLVSKTHGNFIVNIGISDSVKTGMPIVNSDGLVGIITDASENFSVVRTLGNSVLNLAVTNQRSNVNGILSWNGNALIIKNIPSNFDNEIGDRIVTSEFSTILPPSIPVGVISEKETNIAGVLTNLVVQPFTDFTAMKNIFAVKFIESEQINELELNLLKK
ncbi:MAG: rod shape-determining protein MreC [Ignavibacteriae bacterium]|nr:rod shape-determining protein MreC [Ignavibacteriota bacterium]NOG97425.1 rod shape-determining protein MreC [Ignavibacteriota bacterium]